MADVTDSLILGPLQLGNERTNNKEFEELCNGLKETETLKSIQIREL